jgi:hypothetical protein
MPKITKEVSGTKEVKPAAKKAAKKASVPAETKKAAVVEAPAKSAGKKASKKSKGSGEIVYPELRAEVYGPDNPITVDLMKAWLGWKELPADHEGEFLLKDENGTKVICLNNAKNRPYSASLSSLYAQEILRGHWKLNGETMIFGNYGQAIAVQHRGIGLILAWQKWANDKAAYPYWKSAPTIQSFVAFGISEDDETVNTIDTGKPRTFSDAVYRSSLFENLSGSAKKNACRILDFAVRCVWNRTGRGVVSYAPRRTHSEAFEFVNAHETLLKCVRHIMEENDENRVGRFIPPGTAAGLMYMMACSTTDRTEYAAAESPTENYLNFENYDKAEAFWVGLASGSKLFAPLKAAISKMIEDSFGGSPIERISLIVLAWTSFLNHGKVLEKDLKLEYHTDEETGATMLMECPSVGGIDLGNPAEHEDAQEATPEEMESTKNKIKQEKASKGKVAKGSKQKPDMKNVVYLTPADLKVGDKVWVGTSSSDENKWMGIYRSHYKLAAGPIAKIEACEGYAGAGKLFDASFESLYVIE